MEEYLRRVQSRVGAGASEDHIHAVLGGPKPDVDTVAATLSLALHLSQKETPGGLCLPVLCGERCAAILPEDTLEYLQRLNIGESLLLWRDDVDLLTLHHTGKLSLTLLRDGLLDSSEYHALESSVLRVVHQDGQQDTGADGASFSLTTVAKEIRQEAAEHIRATLGKTLGEALRLQSGDLSVKHGGRSARLEELRRSVEVLNDAAAGRPDEAKIQHFERLLATKLREFTDGEMTIALSSVTTEKEVWLGYVDELKSFNQRRGLDGLVVLLSVSDTVHHPYQQVAVYSNNTDILNQICCELEESSSWSLSGALEERENLQVYHIPIDASSCTGALLQLEEEIQGLLKEFVDRRSSVLACHPSSRTSSTEGVAGSVEFSQGSSGINDMDGSDIDRAEEGSADVVAIARAVPNGEEDTGGVGVSAGGELVSPDSGMTTIRSSRSSKESSVFLSDDSPVGDVMAVGGSVAGPGGLFLRNPSPLGLLSISPPVPPERRKHRSNRNRNDNFDLFSFDPLHGGDRSLPAGGELTTAEIRGDSGEIRADGSNLSELEEQSLLDFSDANSLDELDSRNSSTDHHGHINENEIIDTVVPPTPVNSLVGSRPPSSCGIRFFPEDVAERINGLQHKDSVSSSLSETWDELSFDTQGAFSSTDDKPSNRIGDYESLQDIVKDVEGKDIITDIIVRESKDVQQRPKGIEPQLSVVTEQTESCENWYVDSALNDQWNPVTLADLQLTPPEEEGTGKFKPVVLGANEKTTSTSKKKAVVSTLTPETSKEEDEGLQAKKNRQTELLDFWTYSAQKGFLKSDSGTTTSYPESLDMWNMTIRDDSLSPLTTPDNLSENSGSFCGVYPNVVGSTSVESPPGFSDGGMKMWNTTIQEDSSSTVSPDVPENGTNLSHVGSPDVNDSEEDNGVEQNGGMNKVMSQMPKEAEWRGNEHNVKIVIETAESTLDEKSGEGDIRQTLTSEHSENECIPYKAVDMSDLPVSGMVTSTSEYDNVGADVWSLTSSPETYASPAADMEGQSSPFVAVTKPDSVGTTKYSAVISDKEQPVNQVFLFEGTSVLGHVTRSGESSIDSDYDNKSKEESAGAEWIEQPSDSPFFMVDSSSVLQTDQSLSPSVVNWKGSESASLSHTPPITVIHEEDGTAADTRQEANKENNGNMEGKITEDVSLSSDGKRDAQKYSPESLHPGSRDEVRSNSDGDSSSGLEMDYIVVSGTVKDAEREWHDRPRHKHTKGASKSMETFSMLVYAATALQNQAQDAHREKGENVEQSEQTQMIRVADSALHMVLEKISPSQSKTTLEAYPQSDSGTSGISQTQGDDGNFEDKSSVVPRSVSPSLRYPSDVFLKAREEVYVRSQISMEDSDEGGQSPSAPPPCPTSLGDFQDWGGHLARQDTSETQSPVLTNSSVSHHSSLTGTPLSESGISDDRGLGLPFSGDLMEEEEQEEDDDVEHVTTESTLQVQSEKEERRHLGSYDLLSFTEELSGGSSIQQPVWIDDRDKWSTDQQTGSHEVSQNIYSFVSRHQDASSQPSSENPAYQWTGGHSLSQGQTQYGYNYHHIDQRTENQSMHAACVDTKPDSQQNTTDVYAEFTTDAKTSHYQSAQAQSYYEAGDKGEYTLADPNSRIQYIDEGQYGDDPDTTCYSRLQRSQYPSDGQCEYETERAQYQYDGQQFYQSDVHAEREDHAQYVAEGYVHFLLSRQSQQRDDDHGGGGGAGVTAMKMASSEEADEELENREDPPSSADQSGSSNQRRRLAAPPMNVSLDRSEGSLLSEDALDTEDDALDTGDDLDINIDELDTPDEADSLELNQQGVGESEESNLGAGAASGEVTAGHGFAEESRHSRLWRSVVIGDQEHRIDMKCIEPYKRVISHGGYYAEKNAIIVFAACFLPDSDCDNYNYVMENLFLYVISTLELMVAEDYMIVYLNGATPRRRMPGFSWMKRCYQMIDRRLKKNLKMFIIVHPSWFIRTLLGITRPFISSKFSSKIKYVNSLRELGEIIPMEYVHIPASIVILDTDLQDTAAKADKRGNSSV